MFYETAAVEIQIKGHIHDCLFLAFGNFNDLPGLFKNQTIASHLKSL
jgi:hypothetical protein